MATFATWNPSDKSTKITLSGSDLIATQNTGGSWAGVRSTIGQTSGKWYWEITINSTASNSVAVGVQGTGQTLDGYNNNASAWWYNCSNGGGGKKVNNGTEVSYGVTYSNGQIIGVAWDADAGTLEFYVNNSSQGVAYSSGVSGSTLYACFYAFPNTGGVTANFGASAFTYSVPSGYNPGLYSGTIGSESASLSSSVSSSISKSPSSSTSSSVSLSPSSSVSSSASSSLSVSSSVSSSISKSPSSSTSSSISKSPSSSASSSPSPSASASSSISLSPSSSLSISSSTSSSISKSPSTSVSSSPSSSVSTSSSTSASISKSLSSSTSASLSTSSSVSSSPSPSLGTGFQATSLYYWDGGQWISVDVTGL